MAKKQIYKHVVSIRVSDECFYAKKYLKKYDVNTDALFREGGEDLVIDRAKEFKFRYSKDHVPF